MTVENCNFQTDFKCVISFFFLLDVNVAQEAIGKTTSREVVAGGTLEQYQASIKLVEDVKIVNRQNQTYEEFDLDNRLVYILEKDSVFKSFSSSRPGQLSNLLARLNKSIGRIACGDSQGTCFLVFENMVITCYHVFLKIVDEQKKAPTMPIEVAFEYYSELQNAVVVEVDKEYTPTWYSEKFDYILLRIKESDHLKDRVSLGKYVRGMFYFIFIQPDVK